MKLMNILVPIDFSACSKNALKIAIGLAKKSKAKLHLVNAIHIPTPQAYVASGQVLIDPILSDYERSIEKEFENLKNEFSQLNDIVYSPKKFISTVADAVYSSIQNDRIDLIVMGTKGSHSSLEKLVGGVSAEVISLTKTPVLLIPENVTSLKLNKIGFAADFDAIGDLNKLESVVFFAGLVNAEVQVFNVTKSINEISFEKSRQSLKISNYLQDIKHSFHSVEDEKVVHGIFDFIDKHDLGMLVIYPRQHGLLERIIKGSTTKKVVMNIHIPLLSIHE